MQDRGEIIQGVAVSLADAEKHALYLATPQRRTAYSAVRASVTPSPIRPGRTPCVIGNFRGSPSSTPGLRYVTAKLRATERDATTPMLWRTMTPSLQVHAGTPGVPLMDDVLPPSKKIVKDEASAGVEDVLIPPADAETNAPDELDSAAGAPAGVAGDDARTAAAPASTANAPILSVDAPTIGIDAPAFAADLEAHTPAAPTPADPTPTIDAPTPAEDAPACAADADGRSLTAPSVITIEASASAKELPAFATQADARTPAVLTLVRDPPASAMDAPTPVAFAGAAPAAAPAPAMDASAQTPTPESPSPAAGSSSPAEDVTAIAEDKPTSGTGILPDAGNISATADVIVLPAEDMPMPADADGDMPSRTLMSPPATAEVCSRQAT